MESKRAVLLPLLSAMLVWSCSSEKPTSTYNASTKTGVATETADGTPLPSPTGDAKNTPGSQTPDTKTEPQKEGEGKAEGEAQPPTDETPTVDFASHGQGGLTGNQELKSASGLNFLMNAPADVHSSGKSYGLLVLLHGSTASNYRNFVRQMAKVSTQFDLIPVSVLAPNGQGWNEGGEVNAANALHALVQDELIKKFNIDTRKVLFSGQSSGGGFLSTHFIPLHAKDYTGGAFMQCGAASPRVAFTPDDATKSKFRLHFEITSGDPIWPASYKQALTKYEAAGMTFSKDDTKAGGHCAFDQQQVIIDHIGFILGQG